MKIEGNYTFDAPEKIVWESLLDPDILANTLPGCEKLEKVGDNEYEGALKIKVGPVQGVFKGTVTLTDIVENEGYTMQVNGRGAGSFVKGTGHVKLEAQDGSTVIHYTGDAQVGGRIASVGQRLLDSSAKSVLRQSLDNLDKQIVAKAAPAETTDAAPETEAAAQPATAAESTTSTSSTSTARQTPPAPSTTEFAAGVARDMLDDLLPIELRPKIFAVVVGVVVLMIFLNSWSERRERLFAERVAKILAERG